MDPLIPHLKRLGLGEHEAHIYGVLLTASPASATFIAKRCQLSRSSVYTTVSALIAKGLVGTSYKNTVKQFVAQDDASLARFLAHEEETLAEKRDALLALQEHLRTLARPSLHVPQIVLFEGQEGLKKIYLSMMREAREGETLYLLRDEFVWQPEWKFIFSRDWHDRVKRLKTEKRLTQKLLINHSKEELTHAGVYRAKRELQVRTLPPKQAVHAFAMYILGDTVSLLSMESTNLIGIKIVNPHFAKNFTGIFLSLWESSRELVKADKRR